MQNPYKVKYAGEIRLLCLVIINGKVMARVNGVNFECRIATEKQASEYGYDYCVIDEDGKDIV